MRIVKSTRSHKLSYAFPYFVEFNWNTAEASAWAKWSKHFEDRYGPSSEYRNLEGRKLSVLCYNANWREERNKKAKRLRIYVKEHKDITWAQLNLA